MTSAAGQELREAFKVFDADHDGFINAADIKRTMATMGDDLSDDDVAAMIHEAGADDEGKITYDGEQARQIWNRAPLSSDHPGLRRYISSFFSCFYFGFKSVKVSYLPL